jgi:hypothetical protein
VNDPKLADRNYELARYQEACNSGAKHLALLHLIRCRLLSGGIDSETPSSPRSLVIIPRRHPAEPIAFLGCFSNPDRDYVMLLKSGVNRIGSNTMIGDHSEIPRGTYLLEARQWLIICRSTESLIADDHSTNGSVILLGNAPEVREVSFPYPLSSAKEKPGHVTLDWYGNVVYELKEGDVLITAYAAFIYGRVPPQGVPAVTEQKTTHRWWALT